MDWTLFCGCLFIIGHKEFGIEHLVARKPLRTNGFAGNGLENVGAQGFAGFVAEISASHWRGRCAWAMMEGATTTIRA